MIEFASVSKTYRNGAAAVVDLSLTVPAHEITVVVGPGRSGTSTTLRMVNRLVEPTRGRITFLGKPLRSQRRTGLRRRLGYVNRGGGLFPHRTVGDNIATVPGLLGWSKARTQQRSEELLDLVGLDAKLAHRYPVQLAEGQPERVALARALAGDPQVLLMDEPFAGVNPLVRAELHELLGRLQREQGQTVLLATHDIDEAVLLGDQVAVLRGGGRLAQVGRPQQLLDDPADAFVDGFLGRDRGYRSLQFLPAADLALGRVQVVREVTATSGPEPTLVVDADARPLGWADPAHPGQAFALGATFTPGSDTLRAALDAALTSPVGLAVAVESGTGRYAGVVDAQTILGRATGARASLTESLPVRTVPGEATSAVPSEPIPSETAESSAVAARTDRREDEESESTQIRVLVEADAGVRR